MYKTLLKRIFYLYANSVISFLHMYVYHKKIQLRSSFIFGSCIIFLLSLG